MHVHTIIFISVSRFANIIYDYVTWKLQALQWEKKLLESTLKQEKGPPRRIK